MSKKDTQHRLQTGYTQSVGTGGHGVPRVQRTRPQSANTHELPLSAPRDTTPSC